MQICTASLVTETPRARVFAYLATLENLPRWATEFCRQLKREEGHYKVVTSQGELFCRIEADEKSGVIDFLAGPTLEQMSLFPMRVVALPGGASAVLMTLFQSPEMSAEEFAAGFESLQREFAQLKRELEAE